ncbi:MAG: DNA primase, partial [Meiothermus ruber]|nr:DNA primase [Meiothermus ruber]
DVYKRQRSHSEADLALASALMWWTGNDLERADRLFRQSALYRPKWDKKHYSDGRTYGQATLEKARAVDGGYQPRVVSVNRRGQVHTAAKSTAHTTRIAPLDGLAAGGEVLGQPRYRIAHGRIEAAKVEGKGEHQSVTYWPLANFAAVVAREVETTDGLESEQIFELVGYTATGRPLPAAKVKAAEFAGMTWPVRAWGAEVVVTPGQGAKDHLRAAIQYLSIERGFDRAKVYKHLGWTQVNGEYVYLHAGGGIGAQGSVAGLEVEPGKTLEAFAFPDPPTGQDERQAVEAMLEVLDAAPERITAPLLLHTLAAPLGHSPVSIYLAGPTGARKTSLALVLQSFFGYHAAPPAAWEATPNALENAAFLAKDALLLIDDYAPQASEQKQKELQAKAARLLRSQGNSTGRLRMKADGSLAGDRPPRGSLLITGEDIPPGHSIRARGLFVEVERGDVDLARLSRLQTLARDGALARGMAAWIRYLAGRLDAVRRQVEARTAELRGRWEAEHGRTTDALARLHAVWEFFRDYAAGLGLDVATLEQRLLAGLEAVRAAQSTYQRDADPVQRFMTLLFTALRMGRCHLLPVDWRPGQDPEEHMAVPQNYGWRWVDTTSGSSEAHGIWQPQGPRIGWLPENPDVAGIYLDPTAAYAVLSRLAGETGEPLPTERTLWKRLAQAGAIRTQVSGGETRYQVGVRIHERTTRAIHLLGAYISKTGNTGNNGNNSVPDSENRVAGFENVAGSDRQQNRAPNEPSGLLPETTGNTTATGNNGSPVPDAKNTGVAGVAGSTDIGGQAAHTETREPENREKRGRLEL